MFFGRFRLLMGRGPAEELLDRPLSNFDVLGIPTGAWSSSLFGCFNNVIPSCVLSFFCPCIMWGQIVVRAQIPMLIGIKNSLHFLRSNSGFGAFVEYFLWSFILSLALLGIIIGLSNKMPSIVSTLLAILLAAVLCTLLGVLVHTRVAFRENFIPCEGASFWDKMADALLMITCMPCALAQMARHVFQYDKMDTDVGLYLGDPSALPPLRPTPEQAAASASNPSGAFERPPQADNAGLHSGRQQGRSNTGAAHRQEAIERRQREELEREGAVPVVAEAQVQSVPSAPPVVQARVVR